MRTRLRWLAFGALAVAIIIPGLNDLGAAIEAKVAPVIEDQVTYGGRWHDREFCWRWAFRKAQRGVPEDFTTVLVRLKDGRQAFLPVYRGDEGRPLEPERTADAGQARDVLLCSMMPPWIDPTQAFDVVGSVLYARPHGLWSVRVPMPTVEWRP